MIFSTIKKQLLDIIEKEGESINSFCVKIGVNQSNINKFLKDKKYTISIIDLEKISNYYKFPLYLFFINRNDFSLSTNTNDLSRIINMIMDIWSDSDDREQIRLSESIDIAINSYKERLEKRGLLSQKKDKIA